MKKELVTVLTPCYNGEKYIHRYIESILNQDYENIELILIDDGSTDRTTEVVKKYEKLLSQKCKRFIFYKVHHGGQARAINFGLKFVEGEYLIWPDSDDYLSFDSISKRVEFLIKNPQYDFVRSNGYNVDFESLEKITRISDAKNRFKEDIFMDLIEENTFCACGCYMIKTELLFEIYPEKEIFVSSAGQNWQLLIPYSGRYKCGFIDKDLYFICIRYDSHSRVKRDLYQEFERLDLLKEILKKTIPLANRNDCNYNDILERKYSYLKFIKSYQYVDKINVRKYFNILNRMNIITKKEIIMFLEINHKNCYRIYRLLSSFFDKVKGGKNDK